MSSVPRPIFWLLVLGYSLLCLQAWILAFNAGELLELAVCALFLSVGHVGLYRLTVAPALRPRPRKARRDAW